jgi:hypothetical protein
MALTKVGKEGITGISNSSDATAITIDSSENVGIGTSSPGTFRTKIKQSGTGTTQGMGVEASANDSVLRMFHTGSAAGFNATYSSSGAYVPLTFDVGGAERMRINTNGKIEADKASNPALSGVTNRNTILQLQNTDTGYVAGNATAIDFGTSLTSATASIIVKNDNAGSGYGGNLIFATSPTSGDSLTQRVVIANDGSIFMDGMSGSASAMANVKINGNNELHKDTSARISKSEIADLHIGLDEVVALTPRKFKRGENTVFEIGFIADEMASVVPEVVMRGPKSWITDVETDTEEIDISIEYDKLTALLTMAIQELKTDLDAEKAKVADLITRVTALEDA